MYKDRVPQLVINPSENLHLLSLLVRDRLEAALETVEGRDAARRLKGRIGLVASGMETALTFEGRSIDLDQRPLDDARAIASGTLASFLAICHGRVRLGDVVKRQIRVSGNLLLFRRFFPLLTMGMPDEDE